MEYKMDIEKTIENLLILKEELEKQKQEEQKHKKTSKKLLPLSERVKTDDLHPYGGGNPISEQLREEARKTGESWDKLVAKYIRKHLRERFPEVKFSVKSGGAGWLEKVQIYILSSPYDRKRVFVDAFGNHDKYGRWENSPELESILKYCNALHDSFDADDGDYYADYGAFHDLYGGAEIDSKYFCTEVKIDK